MLDNNVLNTPNLEALVDDLCAAGFGRGAKYVDPGAYNIVMMRYHNGDRAGFLDKKMMAYLEKFKKRIKSPEMLDTFLQIIIGAEDTENFAEYMLEHEAELTPIIEKYRNKTAKARYLDFNQGVDGRKINDENMTQLARLAIRPLRIAFDDIKLKDKYCAAVRTAHKHGIKEISNYILFNYKDKPEDLYERLRINIELNRELGIQIFSFPMKYSPIDRTDRDFIGANWTKKSIRAISAILQVTKGVVAAGSDFFYKAFGSSLDEYFELLAMPRELIMFRYHFGGWHGDYELPISDQPEQCKEHIRKHIQREYSYDLSRTLDEIRPGYQFNETCQETVPQAIIAFLESRDFEDAIRNAISLGGDSDTLAAITGSIAEAAYGVPDWIEEKALSYLDVPLLDVVNRWKQYLKPISQ